MNVVTGEMRDRVRAHGGASGALVVPGRGYPCEVTGAADRLRGVGAAGLPLCAAPWVLTPMFRPSLKPTGGIVDGVRARLLL